MSKAHDYLKEIIAAALGTNEADAFWARYNELRRLDARDSTANSMRRKLRIAEQVLQEYQRPTWIRHYTMMRDKARAWLVKHGYSEDER